MASNVPTLNDFKLPNSNNNPPPSRQFSRDKMLLKKPSKRKCLLNILLKLNRGCLGPWSHIFLTLVILMTKQKIFKGKSSSALFNAKNVAKSNVP